MVPISCKAEGSLVPRSIRIAWAILKDTSQNTERKKVKKVGGSKGGRRGRKGKKKLKLCSVPSWYFFS